MKLALVTSSGLSHPDSDLPLLVSELAGLDIDTDIVAWDDSVEWASYDAAIVRSTWDYHRRLAEFDHWLTVVSTETQLWNPADLIRWNSDKRYLADLSAKGLPTVPTHFIDRTEPQWHSQLASVGDDIVIKPTVGAGSHGVRRFTNQFEGAITYVEDLLGSGITPMAQPYLSDIDTYGEVGLVTAGGTFTHAFHKEAILNGEPQWSGDDHVVEVISTHLPTEAEQALCDRVLSVLPLTAYARIDLLPTIDGPMISEVELIEPSLFLEVDSDAAGRVARAFASVVRR